MLQYAPSKGKCFMKTKKKQVDAEFIYLVKIAWTKKALEQSNPIPGVTWAFWDKNYREKKSMVAISVFSSRKEAQKAIDRELVLLKRENAHLKKDIRRLLSNVKEPHDHGLRELILQHIYSYTNPNAIGKLPVFKIVRTGADTWKKLWSSTTDRLKT